MDDNNYPFMGTFDGMGFTIRNLKIKNTHDSLDAQGFFGLAWQSTIKNVKFDGVTIEAKAKSGVTTNNYVGVISGYMYASTVTDVTVSNVTADLERVRFGIMAGYMYACKVVNSGNLICDNRMYVKGFTVNNADVTIRTAGYATGMAGYMHLYYEWVSGYPDCPVNSFDNIKISGLNVKSPSAPSANRVVIAGISGWQQGRGVFKITNSNIDLNVDASGDCMYMIAGAVNHAFNPHFENTNTKGTIIDNGSSKNTVIGGFANALRRADSDGGLVKGCDAAVNIQSTNGTVGGFLSEQSCSENNVSITIEECNATGDVSGRIAGGFIGKVYGANLGSSLNDPTDDTPRSFRLNIKNSTASGDVRGSEVASGFIGAIDSLEKGSSVGVVTLNITNSGSSSDVFGTELVNGVLASVDEYSKVQPIYPDANWWFTGRINPVDLVPEELLPQTGDHSRMMLWIVMLGLSCMLLAGRKRRAA